LCGSLHRSLVEENVVHPVVKIYDQSSFERCDLNGEFAFAISIQNKGSYPVILRPDFRGRRLNLYFDDVTEGVGAATSADIDALFDFAQRWLSVAHADPALASIVSHCGAGISRSAAAALMLLSLYFGAYHQAAAHLFRIHPNVSPNALMCRLIGQKLGSGFGPDIFEALARGKGGAG
jgi:predicted protein tyrosine phosphatase